MSQDRPQHAAQNDNVLVRAGSLIAFTFLALIITLATPDPLLTLLVESLAAILLIPLFPLLSGLKHLPYIFLMSQHIYRTTEPEHRISLAEEREMRRQLRQLSMGQERR